MSTHGMVDCRDESSLLSAKPLYSLTLTKYNSITTYITINIIIIIVTIAFHKDHQNQNR